MARLLRQSLLIIALLVLGNTAFAAESLTARIQKQYDSLKGFEADFVQTLTNAAALQHEERAGHISFQQPGLIRWETSRPDRELLVVGEKEVWNYFPEDKTVIKYPAAQILESKTMVRFLSGQAKLDEDFKVEDQGDDGGIRKLRLTPKQPEPGLVSATVWADPQSALIRKVTLVDFYGNSNQVELTTLKLNPQTSRETFTFTPPAGVKIQDNTK